MYRHEWTYYVEVFPKRDCQGLLNTPKLSFPHPQYRKSIIKTVPTIAVVVWNYILTFC